MYRCTNMTNILLIHFGLINSMPLVITSPPISPIFPFLLSLVFFLFHVWVTGEPRPSPSECLSAQTPVAYRLITSRISIPARHSHILNFHMVVLITVVETLSPLCFVLLHLHAVFSPVWILFCCALVTFTPPNIPLVIVATELNLCLY